MANFNLDNYEPVEERIRRFWEKYPNGRIITDVVHVTETGGVFKAEIYTDREDDRPATIDFAEEVKGSSPVNRTSWLENGLTSAIGRALADLGFSPKGSRPSREEMQKVERGATPNKSATPKPVAKFEADKFIAEIEKATTRDDLNAIWPKYAGFADFEFLYKDNTVTPKSLMQARATELEAK